MLNKETKLLLLKRGMKKKTYKKKDKKRKKKRTKTMQWREGLKKAKGKEKELKEEKEEECKAQVLNGERESEREIESYLCKSIRKIFFCSARLLQLCGSVEKKVSDFSIFFVVYK